MRKVVWKLQVCPICGEEKSEDRCTHIISGISKYREIEVVPAEVVKVMSVVHEIEKTDPTLDNVIERLEAHKGEFRATEHIVNYLRKERREGRL